MWCPFERRTHSERGFSLIEVVLVVLIMGILSAIAAQKWSGAVEQSRFEATRSEMDRLVAAIVGHPELFNNGVRSSFGYVGDVGALPANLDALVTNPGLGTWKGPYVQNDFTQNPNDFKQDAWGVNYSYAGGVTITSNGSGSPLTKQFASAAADLTANTVEGVVTDGLGNPPGDSASQVFVRITYPNGAGSAATATVSPGRGGSYSFSGTIPIGNHTMRMIYKSDTLDRRVTVLPRSTAFMNFRIPASRWAPKPTPTLLEYVAGSAGSSSAGQNFSFQIINNTGASKAITSIRATYTPVYYYETIRIRATTVFSGTSPRGASGETKAFASLNIANGETVTVEYNSFKICSSGGCGSGDMRTHTVTVDFSDGSSVTFTVP